MKFNQYVSVLRASVAPCEILPLYDADGNMTSDGTFSYAYDAASRLVSVSSNGVPLVTNFYDAQSRRVRKATPEATATYFYDGWNLIEERVAHANGATSTIRYYWGKDSSDSLQGAGGIGGLLYLTIDGEVYVPLYDNNGNVTHYCNANGAVVASYAYDAFGKAVTQSGPLADFFRHRFSTKYHDSETDLYYYGYRFYAPSLMRWLNRDPIEERGGRNLYGFCGNNAIASYDRNGNAYFAVRGLGKVLPPVNWSWFFACPFMKFAADIAADVANVELLHEQLFFEDGSNIGWGNDDKGLGVGKEIRNESSKRYARRDGGYDDCVMRKSVEEVDVKHYQLTWVGARMKCNCQDYADMLRAKYWELIKNPKIRCQCGLDDK